MSRIIAGMEKLQAYWGLGFVLTLIVGSFLLFGWAAANLLLVGLGAVFGFDPAPWAPYSAILWAPPLVGFAFHKSRRYFPETVIPSAREHKPVEKPE